MADLYRIMLAVSSADEVDELLPLAAAWLHHSTSLAREQTGEIMLIGTITVPEDQNLSTGAAAAQSLRAAMNLVHQQRPDLPIRIKARVRVNHQPWAEVLVTLKKERPDLLMVPWSGDPEAVIMGAPLKQLLAQSPCDLAVVRSTDWNKVKHILLPIRGGPYTELLINFTLALAETINAEITVLHASRQGQIDQPYTSYLPMLRNIERINRQVTVVDDVSEAILRETDLHGLVVMGASSRPGKIGLEPLGPIASRVATGSSIGLVLLKSPSAPITDTPHEVAPPTVKPILPLLVDKWFAENTFDAAEFDAIDRLVALKRRRGVSISLALPALNEEKTVGTVIRTVRKALMGKRPLLDEIVLIDSGSDDRTREIAKRLGVPVYIHQEILPGCGAHSGKGEALWKSLHVTQGDLIAWIDTDIVNIHPRFVYGVIGPLLRSDHIQYVKGFYRRPLRVGDKLQAGGGGRVTELVARPLLNLFFPELSGLIQPLSGEYAGRRTALERVPFFTGYGVETGLLIDLLNAYGLRAIAQVDLQERVHHNQPLEALSRMSFAIIQVIIARLEDRHKITLLQEINRSMKIVQHEADHYYLDLEEIGDQERPPIASIDEYRRRHGLKKRVKAEASR
jgi:glycosyltransferase involved in cell wall biosynthesis